jgi:hypothetical protein
MTEANPRAERRQAGLGRRLRRSDGDSELLGGTPDRYRISDWVCRRELEQADGLGGKGLESPPEAVFDTRRERVPATSRSRLPAARRQLSDELDQANGFISATI